MADETAGQRQRGVPVVLEFASIAMTAATGFVAGGILASFHQLVTDRPASFQVEAMTLAHKLWTAMVIIFSGPVILMRNGVRGRIIEGRPLYWLVMTSAIATGWSFCSGILFLHVALAI